MAAVGKLANLPGTTLNWEGTAGPTKVGKDQWMLKGDHIINSKNRFSLSYEDTIPWFLGSGKGKTVGQTGHNYVAGGSGYILEPQAQTGFIDDRGTYRWRFNYTWILNPRLLLNFRAGITRQPHRIFGSFPETSTGALSTLGRDAGLSGTLTPNSPDVSIQNFSGFGPIFGHGILLPFTKTPLNLDLSWTKGSHNFKFGANYLRIQAATISDTGGNGSFSFQARDTGLPGLAKTGSGYASFLLGTVDSASVQTPLDDLLMDGAWSWYGQDTWRLTSKLTVNYGLRYNLYIPFRESNNKVTTFDPTIPNPEAGGRLGAMSVFGIGPGRNGRRLITPYYRKAFEPRLGFAYALNQRTAFRAHYGIFYGPAWQEFNGTIGSLESGFAAFLSASTLDAGVTPAFNWNTGFPIPVPPLPNTDPSFANGTSLPFVNNDNRPQMTQSIGAEVSRELPGQIELRIGYVGTFAHRIPGVPNLGASSVFSLNALPLSDLNFGSLLSADINSAEARAAGIPIPFPGFSGSVAQALRPFPQYLDIPVYYAHYGNSGYNALQVNLQKHFGQGLAFLINYTKSKMMDNLRGPQHQSLLSSAKALSPFDRPWTVNLNWSYELPFGSGKHFLGNAKGPLNQLVGGWKVSSIQNYWGGFPISVTSELSNPIFGAWPVLMPGVPITATSCGSYDPGNPARNRALNINAFQDAAPFALGNVRSLGGSARQCAYVDEDLGLEKDFTIHERITINFGTMMSNVFNRHSFGFGLGSDIDNPASFGRYTVAQGGRMIQLYTKVSF